MKDYLLTSFMLWLCLMALCGMFYLPWHEPVFAGVLLLVSAALSWAFRMLDRIPFDDIDVEPFNGDDSEIF